MAPRLEGALEAEGEIGVVFDDEDVGDTTGPEWLGRS
jgi:hypothetical protein